MCIKFHRMASEMHENHGLMGLQVDWLLKIRVKSLSERRPEILPLRKLPLSQGSN
jgi:hypothetical protein